MLRVPPGKFENSARFSLKVYFQTLVFGIWLLFVFYESRLIGCLISKTDFDRQVTVAKVISLLEKDGYKFLTSAHKENSDWLLRLKNSYSEEFRNLYDAIVKNKETKFFENFEEAFDFFLRNPSEPFILDASSDKALYYSAKYSDIDYFTTPAEGSDAYRFVFPKNSPLKKNFNHVIRFSEPIFQQIINRYTLFKPVKLIVNAQSLTVAEVMGAFYLLGLGCGIAVIIFIFEIFRNR